MDNFYNNEDKRQLKNEMLTSLLIKFVCRCLPNEPEQSQSRDLFEMIKEKNMNLPEDIRKELEGMKIIIGASVKDAIDVTNYFYKKRKKIYVQKKEPEIKKSLNNIIIDDNIIQEKKNLDEKKEYIGDNDYQNEDDDEDDDESENPRSI